MRKKTLEEFISEFTKRYPEKHFSFKKSRYKNSHEKMSVVCEHGHTFEIRPCDLINGYGCPVCGGTKKMTNEEFIQKATYVHNNYFSYEHCVLNNVNKKVIVTCPVHGDFEVKANNHLNGCNCIKCNKEGIKHNINKLPVKNTSTKKLTTKDFVERVKEKWGDRYTLSENSEYESSRKPVTMICKLHGEFSITPNHLLSGRGCPVCGRNKQKTKEEIINEIIKAQPYSDYDYSLVEYRGIHKNITLKCNKCGTVFSNAPSNLIKYKNGCPGCNGSQLELEVEDFLKKNNIKYEREKRFDWLFFNNKQSIDFFLPDFNAAIECQGIQHFQSVNFGGSETNLEETKERDRNKRILCEQHGVRMFYYSNFHIIFPYYVYEDKEKMLNDIKTFS